MATTTATAPLVTRIATPEDIDELMELAIEASAENGFLNADPARLLQGIWPALHQDHGIVGVIGPEGGKIEGAVLLHVSEHWYSSETFLEEKSIFVRQGSRGAKDGRAAKLVDFSKKVADTLGLPLLIGVLSNARTAGKVRLYQRAFGEPAGAFFLYGAATGRHSGTEH